MKKYIFAVCCTVLTACSTSPQQQSHIPLDMQTVQEYQQRVASARTNTQAEHWDLNSKEAPPKVVIIKQSKRHSPYFSHHFE